MAYKGSYAGNPDALPASVPSTRRRIHSLLTHSRHVEPEEAARILSKTHISRPASTASIPVQRPIDRRSTGNTPASPRYSSSQSSKRPDVSTGQQSQSYAPSRYSSPMPMSASPSKSRYNNQYGPPPVHPSQALSYGENNQSRPQPNLPPRTPIQGNRPQSLQSMSSPSPHPLSRDEIWPLFAAVDSERTGELSESDLSRALVNADYTAFDPHTVRMMIRMFDLNRSGRVNFDEFCALWGFLTDWRHLFERFDVDKSTTISLREFTDALVAFGYRLSPSFVQLLFGTFAKPIGAAMPGARPEMCLSFDLFVQACISLKRMTDVFKKYDDDRDGYITLSLYVSALLVFGLALICFRSEEFLTGAQSLFLFNSVSHWHV